MSELTPKHLLVDLFDSNDFPVPIPDPEAAAKIVIQRLTVASFEIKAPAQSSHEHRRRSRRGNSGDSSDICQSGRIASRRAAHLTSNGKAPDDAGALNFRRFWKVSTSP
jgi:hypothetical protein